jgi:hypothetical protein
MLKKFAVLGGAAMVATLFAAPAMAAPCGSPANYSVWVDAGAGFSCTVGSLTFSNFGYSGTGTAAGNYDENVGVTPVNDANGAGFDFNPAMSAGPNEVGDEQISFTVTGSVDDVYIAFNGGFTGTGVSTFSEQLNGSVIASLSNPPPVFSAHDTFPVITSINVLKDLNVRGGTDGSASISDMKNQFSSPAVPEPATLVMMGSGLVGFATRLRRKANRK